MEAKHLEITESKILKIFRNGRKSITALSMIMNDQNNHQSYNSLMPNTVKDKLFFGLGN